MSNVLVRNSKPLLLLACEKMIGQTKRLILCSKMSVLIIYQYLTLKLAEERADFITQNPAV